MSMSDLSSQLDEIEALTAIFGADVWVRDLTRPQDAPPQYSIELRPDAPSSELVDSLNLRVTFPTDYPSQSPPLYQLEGPWLRRPQRQRIQTALDEIYLDQLGDNVVFAWIEKIREILQEWAEGGGCYDDNNAGDGSETSPATSPEADVDSLIESFDDAGFSLASTASDFIVLDDDAKSWEAPEIVSGLPLTDKKSTFQAFLARVVHPKQVEKALEKLKENKKIAHATHNMWAFRVGAGDRIMARCDDDGETHAGSRMLHLLEILEATDVLVVVSRWYGGIHLGPDRFKHISNVTRNILEDQGFLEKTKKTSKGGKKK